MILYQLPKMEQTGTRVELKLLLNVGLGSQTVFVV
jgi:hypothetical protein